MHEPLKMDLKGKDAAKSYRNLQADLDALELSCVHFWTEMNGGLISKSSLVKWKYLMHLTALLACHLN